MKTIETKISKSGATIYYVDGKRVSYEDAMFAQRMNSREAKYNARIEAERREAAMSEVNTTAEAIDVAAEAEIELANKADEPETVTDDETKMTVSELREALKASRAKVQLHFTVKGNPAWRVLFRYGKNDMYVGTDRLTKREADERLAEFGLTANLVIEITKAVDEAQAAKTADMKQSGEIRTGGRNCDKLTTDEINAIYAKFAKADEVKADATGETNTVDADEVNAVYAKFAKADGGKTFTTVKAENAAHALEILGELNFRNVEFVYHGENYSNDYKIAYRHFDGINADGNDTCFGLIEIVINGKLDTVRFINNYREQFTDIKIGDAKYTVGGKGEINLIDEPETKTDTPATVKADENEIARFEVGKSYRGKIPYGKEMHECTIEVIKRTAKCIVYPSELKTSPPFCTKVKCDGTSEYISTATGLFVKASDVITEPQPPTDDKPKTDDTDEAESDNETVANEIDAAEYTVTEDAFNVAVDAEIANAEKRVMRTALVKVSANVHKILRYDDYASQKEFAEELRGNGYKVLKIWNGNISDDEVSDWHFMNRNPRDAEVEFAVTENDEPADNAAEIEAAAGNPTVGEAYPEGCVTLDNVDNKIETLETEQVIIEAKIKALTAQFDETFKFSEDADKAFNRAWLLCEPASVQSPLKSKSDELHAAVDRICDELSPLRQRESALTSELVDLYGRHDDLAGVKFVFINGTCNRVDVAPANPADMPAVNAKLAELKRDVHALADEIAATQRMLERKIELDADDSEIEKLAAEIAAGIRRHRNLSDELSKLKEAKSGAFANLLDKRDELKVSRYKLNAIKRKGLITADEHDAKAAEIDSELRYVELQIDALKAGDAFDYVDAAEHIKSVYEDLQNCVEYWGDEHGLTPAQCEKIYVAAHIDRNFDSDVDRELINRMIGDFKRGNEMTAKLREVTDEAGYMTIICQDGTERQLQHFKGAQVTVCNGYDFKSAWGVLFGHYDTPAQVNSVTEMLKATVTRGDNKFTFLTADKLNVHELQFNLTRFNAPRQMKIDAPEFDKAAKDSLDNYGVTLDINGETLTFEDGKVIEIASARYGAYFKIRNGRRDFYYRGNRVSKRDFFGHIATEDKATDERNAVTKFVKKFGGSELKPGTNTVGNFVVQLHPILANGRQYDYEAIFDTYSDATAFVGDFKALAGDMKFLASIKRGSFYGEVIYRHGLNGQEFFAPVTDEHDEDGFTDEDFQNELTVTLDINAAVEKILATADNFRFLDQRHEISLTKPDSEIMWERDFRGYKGDSSFLITEVYNHPDGTLREVYLRGDGLPVTVEIAGMKLPTVSELKDKPAYEDKHWAVDFDIYHADSNLTDAQLESYTGRLHEAMTANGNVACVELEDCVITVYGDDGGDNDTVDKIVDEMTDSGCWGEYPEDNEDSTPDESTPETKESLREEKYALWDERRAIDGEIIGVKNAISELKDGMRWLRYAGNYNAQIDELDYIIVKLEYRLGILSDKRNAVCAKIDDCNEKARLC